MKTFRLMAPANKAKQVNICRMLRLILFISAGGAIGSLLRFSTGIWLSKHYHSAFPFATFVVNIVGCFLIGLFYVVFERYNWFNP